MIRPARFDVIVVSIISVLSFTPLICKVIGERAIRRIKQKKADFLKGLVSRG